MTFMDRNPSQHNRTPIMLALGFAAFTVPEALAKDEEVFDLYGEINLSIQREDTETGIDNELRSNASHVGAQGTYQLEENLEVFYKLEWQVDVGDNGSGDNLSSRNQFVGLRGNFGEISVGRNDTVLKQSQGNIDIYNDYTGDISRLFEGENRLGDSVTYFTPSYNGFVVGASYIFSSNDAVDDGVSLMLGYGDEDLKASDYFFSAAIDQDVDGFDVWRLSGYTKVADTSVGVILHHQEDLITNREGDGAALSIAHPFERWTAKVQLQAIDFDDGTDHSVSAGVDYKLGARTKAFAWYTTREYERFDVEQNYLAIGLEHKF